MLEIAALFGMPMRPEQIQQLSQLLNESRAEDTLPSEDESGAERPANSLLPVSRANRRTREFDRGGGCR
jgi:hypothetical protein